MLTSVENNRKICYNITKLNVFKIFGYNIMMAAKEYKYEC